MTSSITIPMPKKEKERLNRLALRYGFSLAEFSRRLLEEIHSDIPEESFRDYENPRRLRASFGRALHDWKKERIRAKL